MLGNIAKGLGSFIALFAMLILALCIELMHARRGRPGPSEMPHSAE